MMGLLEVRDWSAAALGLTDDGNGAQALFLTERDVLEHLGNDDSGLLAAALGVTGEVDGLVDSLVAATAAKRSLG